MYTCGVEFGGALPLIEPAVFSVGERAAREGKPIDEGIIDDARLLAAEIAATRGAIARMVEHRALRSHENE